MTQEISSAEWQSKVIDAKGPVLVDFYATWCGPCRMVAPIVEEISQEQAGKVDVYKIDVDESPDIAQRYGVMSIPTLIVFRDGQPAKKTLGAQPKENIMALLD